MWRCAAQEEVASLQLEQFTWWFDGCPRNGTFHLFLHSTQHSCRRLVQFHHSSSLSRANFPRNRSFDCCTHICQMPQEMWKTKAKNLKVDRFSILSFCVLRGGGEGTRRLVESNTIKFSNLRTVVKWPWRILAIILRNSSKHWTAEARPKQSKFQAIHKHSAPLEFRLNLADIFSLKYIMKCFFLSTLELLCVQVGFLSFAFSRTHTVEHTLERFLSRMISLKLLHSDECT